METATTFRPGDIVTADRSRPPSAEPTDQFVVVGPSPGGRSVIILTSATAERLTGWGWRMNTVEARGDTFRAVDGLLCWHISTSVLTKVDDHDARLTPEMELARRRVQIAEYGYEPVLQCRAAGVRVHPSEPHRHSVAVGETRPDHRMFRLPDNDPVSGTGRPGLWGKGRHVTTSHSVMPEVAEPVTEAEANLHPLVDMTALTGRSLTLVSKPTGMLDGSTVVFGCQRWSLDALRAARATVEFGGSGWVTVTVTARVNDDGTVRVADRNLTVRDINEHTERITAGPTVETTENAVVLEHGFYGCATHTGEHILIVAANAQRNSAVGMLNQITRAGGVLNGQVMRRHGFRRTPYSECVPVVASTTINNMELNNERRWAAIPVNPGMVERMREAGLRMVHLPGEQVQRCDQQGHVAASGGVFAA